jgi:hypothetical protein
LQDCDRLVTPLNAGERHVAEKLAALDDSWTIYVQPRLAQDVPDFLAVHDGHGVCAIEVKDWSRGRYRQSDAGTIEYTDSTGGWFESKEKPRYQSYRYRATIFDQFFALPEDGKDPTPEVRAMAVLPNFSTDDARKLLAKSQVVPKHEKHINVYGGDGIRTAINEVLHAKCDVPNPASMTRLRRLLIESATSHDARLPARLSQDARNISNKPSQARRRRVRGPAGCGKSYGLAARAARLAAERKSVLVLAFNTTLSNYLRSMVNDRCRELGANPTLVACVHFQSFCKRIAEDAALAGFQSAAPDGTPRHDVNVVRARQAFAAGYRCHYDAVLIDEGQDFTLDWWNLLRDNAVTPDGAMLLVADPTQDVYDKRAWTDEDRMLGAGFSGPWTDLKGSYRMPIDMVPIANAFAVKYLDGEQIVGEVPTDHLDLFGSATATIRHWDNNPSPAEHGWRIGHEVVRLLTAYPELSPSDVAFLCEHHDEGLDAVDVIEAAGYPMHHIFATSQRAQQIRKSRFWPDAPGVKGCTVHSFKGWETPALVMGIGQKDKSKRLAYVAMTRIRVGGLGRPAYLSVINSDLSIAGFDSTFREWTRPKVSPWAPPKADAQAGQGWLR